LKDSKKRLVDLKLENEIQMHKNMDDLAFQLDNLNKLRALAEKKNKDKMKDINKL
jgi:hypothetical protein